MPASRFVHVITAAFGGWHGALGYLCGPESLLCCRWTGAHRAGAGAAGVFLSRAEGEGRGADVGQLPRVVQFKRLPLVLPSVVFEVMVPEECLFQPLSIKK